MQNLVNLPATLQMDMNHLQSSVTPERTTGIAVVASAEELIKLSGTKMAILVGYNEGSTKGGGTYVHQPEGPGLRIGEWVFQPGQTVTPYHFGANEGGVGVDSGETMQSFLNFLSEPGARDYTINCAGTFGSSIPLVVEGAGYVYGANMFVQALAPMDDVLTFKSCRNSIWVGKIGVKCFGNRHLNKRKGVNGVRIDDCRGAKLCNFSSSEGSGWGVYFGGGNNNMCSIGDVSTLDMGATGKADRTHRVEAIDFATNAKNTIHQNTRIFLSPDSVIPSDAHQMHRAFWISSTGKPYKILNIDRETNSVNVYPLVPTAQQVVGDKSQLVYGGGACCYSGGHTAKGKLGHVSCVRSGIGVWLTGQSSANVEGYTGQFSGIDMVLGSDPDNTFGGSFFGSVYFEASEFADLVFVNQTTANSHGTIFGSSTALDLNDWISLMPKRLDEVEDQTTKQYFPVTFMHGGSLWYPGTGDERSKDEGKYSAISARLDGSPYSAQPTRHTTRINLRHSVVGEKIPWY